MRETLTHEAPQDPDKTEAAASGLVAAMADFKSKLPLPPENEDEWSTLRINEGTEENVEVVSGEDTLFIRKGPESRYLFGEGQSVSLERGHVLTVRDRAVDRGSNTFAWATVYVFSNGLVSGDVIARDGNGHGKVVYREVMNPSDAIELAQAIATDCCESFLGARSLIAR